MSKKKKTKKSINSRELLIKSRKAYRLNQHSPITDYRKKGQKYEKEDYFEDSGA